MNRGDRVRLKSGDNATITAIGSADFVGDPFPVYLTTDKGEKVILLNTELQKRKEKL